MRKICKMLIYFFAIMLLLIQPVSAAQPEMVTVIAEGSGSTKLEALQSAWMEAVRKAVGLFMTSKTEMIDDDLTEKIVTHSRGQVNSYKTLSESQDKGIFNVVIEANIDKDILRQTSAQGKSKKMAIDGAAIAANEDTAAKKKESQQEIILNTLNSLELDKILRYNTELKKFKEGGKTVFYVQHTISIDPQQFKILADQLERTLKPVASEKEILKIDPEWGKGVASLLKNWTYTRENEVFDRFLYNLSPDHFANPLTNEARAYNREPSNSVCIYKNSGKMECYSFNNEVMRHVIQNLKDKYEIVFEIGCGEELSLISDGERIEWPYSSSGSETVYVDPAFYHQGDGDCVMLRYNQRLDLSPEQLLELKEITGKYSIVKK